MSAQGAFLEIVKRFTDPTWGRVRDDLLSRTMKILRKYAEGKKPDDLRDSKLILELEDFYERLYEIYEELGGEVENLLEALGSFVKAPVPCKLKIIAIMEKLTEGER
ncbi:MAG: hypothetical protein GXN96_06125 [Aquificae bacterium]|nr:hypothetical protein [Aquificota bacterium]